MPSVIISISVYISMARKVMSNDCDYIFVNGLWHVQHRFMDDKISSEGINLSGRHKETNFVRKNLIPMKGQNRVNKKQEV